MAEQHTPKPRHTTVPWIADDFFMQDGHRVRIGTNNGDPHYYHKSATICECYIDDDDDSDPKIDLLQAEANAAFIVVAVNNYDRLRAALETCLDEAASLESGVYRLEHPHQQHCRKVIMDTVRAVLGEAPR